MSISARFLDLCNPHKINRKNFVVKWFVPTKIFFVQFQFYFVILCNPHKINRKNFVIKWFVPLKIFFVQSWTSFFILCNLHNFDLENFVYKKVRSNKIFFVHFQVIKNAYDYLPKIKKLFEGALYTLHKNQQKNL